MANVTVKEMVTKLTTKADLSGMKTFLNGLKKAAKTTTATAKKTREEEQTTSKFQKTKAIETLRAKVALMKEELLTKRKLDDLKLRSTKKNHRAEIALLRKKNKEKLAMMKAQLRLRKKASGRTGGRGLPSFSSGGGAGLGSIISGNVIASAITSALSRAMSSVTNFVTGMIDAAAGIEKVRAEFGVMLGDIPKANALIDKLKQTGATTPLQFRDLANQARTLLQYGSAAESVTEELRMIGDVVGGDRERFQFMTFAFAQMKTAGKLMGQELRQMVNAGFNPLSQMAKTTGLTMNQLRKEMEMGTISSEDVVKAFKAATSEGGRFFNNMEVQSRTFTGRMSTMRDEVFMLMEAMGNELLPAAKKSLNGLISFIKNDGRKIGTNLMKSLLPAINAVVQGFERFGRTLFDIRGTLDMLKDKDKTGAFFEDLAKKIDKAFVFITAGALQLKEFLNKNWESITDGFGIILWGIKQLIVYLPELITLWAGLKLAGVATQIAGVAKSILMVVAGLASFAIANPLLAVALAGLAGLGIAAARIFAMMDREKDHSQKMKEAEELNKKANERNKIAQEAFEIEKRLAEVLKSQNLSEEERAKLQARKQKAKEAKEIAEAEARAFAKAAHNVNSSASNLSGDKSVFDDLKQVAGKLTGVKATGPDSFQKAIDKAAATQTTFNINVNTDNKTEITNTGVGANAEDVVEANVGRMYKEQANAAFNGMSQALRTATVR